MGTCHQPRRREGKKEPPRKPPELPWVHARAVGIGGGGGGPPSPRPSCVRPAPAPRAGCGYTRSPCAGLAWPDLLRFGSIEVRLRVLSKLRTAGPSREKGRELCASDSVRGPGHLLSRRKGNRHKKMKSAAIPHGARERASVATTATVCSCSCRARGALLVLARGVVEPRSNQRGFEATYAHDFRLARPTRTRPLPIKARAGSLNRRHQKNTSSQFRAMETHRCD